MTPPRQRYSTAEVAAMTGASLRQLQWWDCEGGIQPAREGQRRLYSDEQVTLVRKVVQLRAAGVGLKRAMAVLAVCDLEGVALVIHSDSCVKVTL